MTPHRCPVCEGRKTVPAGFYGRMQALASTTEEKCQTCDGTGLVWEPPSPPLYTNLKTVIHYPRCAHCGATISDGYHSCPTTHTPTVKWK